jgi:hypothetical protein
MSFVLCSSCRRHVRNDEPTCPFCAASVNADAPPPAAPWRMSRGALFAFASTVAIAGCGSQVDTPVYGAPSPDAATDGATDTGGPGPVYGAPADTGTTADDTGGAMPLYGAAPDK